MKIELKNEILAGYLRQQAESQHTTADCLVERLLSHCIELHLVESLGETTSPEEWARWVPPITKQGKVEEE